MQNGLGLQELARTIVEQAQSKTDLLAHNAMIRSAHVPRHESPKHVITVGDNTFEPNGVFEGQLAQHLNIPKPYYDRMLAEAPELLDQNVNRWLQANEYRDKRRMVRAHGDTARAFLSDGYRPLDNLDLAQAVLPAIGDLQLQVKTSQITDTRMYIFAVNERLRADVKVGDTVQSGIAISNSEVGYGSLRIEHMLFRLVCLNGMIVKDVIRRAHVTRGHKQELDIGVAEYYRDSTRRLDDAAFFSKVRDAVAHTLTPEIFNEAVTQMREATEREIKSPTHAVEVVTKKLGLTEGEKDGLLANLITGGDLSAWGLANAVTAIANSADDYDRSVELQRAGMRVITLPQGEWKEVAKLAA